MTRSSVSLAGGCGIRKARNVHRIVPLWEVARGASTAPWTTAAYAAVDQNATTLLARSPADVERFYPGFDSLGEGQKRSFWVYLLSAISEKESNHRPETSYRENFKDSSGNFVVSRGLLQLSLESVRGYGLSVDTEDDLHDPGTNLRCGAKILAHWLARDGVISGKDAARWLGSARYWSVLRDEPSGKLGQVLTLMAHLSLSTQAQ